MTLEEDILYVLRQILEITEGVISKDDIFHLNKNYDFGVNESIVNETIDSLVKSGKLRISE